METRTIHRDGLAEEITGSIVAHTTSDGHVIETYITSDGKKRFFATLAGTYWCAHGDSVAQAIADALWKDPARRPSMQALVESIQSEGQSHQFTLNEFRLLTGACLTGCRAALTRAKRDDSPMTAIEVRNLISKEWGSKLFEILGWKNEATL